MPRIEQCYQGDDAALSPIIGTQDEQQVFDRDHEDQGPDDQREHPEDILRGGRHSVAAHETLFEGI